MSRVLVICTDLVQRAMAGPGIRALELARVLAVHQPVTLAIPRATDMHEPQLAIVSYGTDGQPLAALLAAADVVVVQGAVYQQYPEIAASALPLAIDLYDPLLLEGLDLVLHGDADDDTAAARIEVYRALTEAQLRRGDFFFCATERQRDYWLGALTALGRVTPALVRSTDRELRGLIDLVPSGIASTPPLARQPVLRGAHPAIGQDDIVLLWAGGLWDWFDPEILVRAVAELARTRPTVRLVFLAGARPNPDGEPIRTRPAARARALADELGVLDRTVIFVEHWVPYAARGAYLAEADVGVSAHQAGVETRFAFRTRLLDYLWARLPYVGSAGDSLAAAYAAAGGGLLVEPGDLGGLIDALRRMVDEPVLRADCRAAIESMTAHYHWDTVARPLAAFCAAPRRTGAVPVEEAWQTQIAALETTLRERDAYIAHVEREYQRASTYAQHLEAAANGGLRGVIRRLRG